jgi:hypothetical protein
MASASSATGRGTSAVTAQIIPEISSAYLEQGTPLFLCHFLVLNSFFRVALCRCFRRGCRYMHPAQECDATRADEAKHRLLHSSRTVGPQLENHEQKATLKVTIVNEQYGLENAASKQAIVSTYISPVSVTSAGLFSHILDSPINAVNNCTCEKSKEGSSCSCAGSTSCNSELLPGANINVKRTVHY